MKKLLLFLCMSVFAASCGGTTPPEPPELPEVPKEPQEVSYYYLGNQKTQLKVRKDLVIVKTSSVAEAETLSKLDIFSSEDNPACFMDCWLIASIDPEKTTVEDVRKLQGVVGATYGLENDHGFPCWPMDKIWVRPVEGKSIESIIDKAGISEYVKSTELVITTFNVLLITLSLNPEHILWASIVLYETGMCEYAEPSFYGGTGMAN